MGEGKGKGKGKGIAGGLAPPARNIIERPRLKQLLDQTGAEVIALVAPAGYGKTTLARQWLAEKTHIWFRASAACSDVAALVLGLAESVAVHRSGATERLRERLAACKEPQRETETLAQMLAEEYAECPPGTVLAIDDYQVASTEEVDKFVFDLASAARIRLVVTARDRPRWATARRLLYGHVFEVNQAALAMTPEEATQILALRRGAVPPGLASLAQGWPAVLGLAALTEDTPPAEDLPDALYNFFAEELYQGLDALARAQLSQLALIPSADSHILEALFGANSHSILDAGIQIGFLTREAGGRISAHPLVQAFLEKKLQADQTDLDRVVAQTARVLITQERWDDAFSLIERFRLVTLLDALVSAAHRSMIEGGRLATLDRWIAFGRREEMNQPILDLLDAEVSFCRAAYERAETLALRAADGLAKDHPLIPRAHIVAGNAAHLSDREEIGMQHHSRALGVATNHQDRREALWGKLICANQLSLPIVEDLMKELEEPQTASPNDRLRLSTMRFVVGLRGSGVLHCLHDLRATHSLVEAATDPHARTAFLHSYSRCLSLGAHYDEASTVADELLFDARRHRLDFVLPHALVSKSLAEVGANRASAALRLLDEAERRAISLNDLHNQLDVRAVRCRLFAAIHDFEQALATSAEASAALSPVAQSEFMVSRAIALLAVGRMDEALALTKEARRNPSHEIHGIARWIELIGTSSDEEDPVTRFDQELSQAIETGVLDGFVICYRAFPDLLTLALENQDSRDRAVPIIRRAGDEKKLRDLGIPSNVRLRGGALSPREKEVYELLVEGCTNKEIAAALFISEVTVKVHVRHILGKVGARSRTEAAIRLAKSPELLDA